MIYFQIHKILLKHDFDQMSIQLSQLNDKV